MYARFSAMERLRLRRFTVGMTGTVAVLTLLASLGCGVMAGVFFAFSTLVMRSLARLPPAYAVAAMQAINVAAVRPPLMLALLGTAAICAVLAVVAVVTSAAFLLAGSVLYLAGVMGLTITYHVPRNNALAAVEPGGEADHWARFAPGWTTWNHVRGAAALLAAAAFGIALGLA